MIVSSRSFFVNSLNSSLESANLNNILKFIDLRTHEGAQWEIQEMAKGMLKIVEKLYPVTVGAYREIRGA